MTLAMIAFTLLVTYLTITARRYGLSKMVSDTYYQLGQRGWIFSLTMVMVAVMMMIAILDTEKGIQCLAFMGCSGLCFVGMAPNYIDKDEYKIHKGGAMVAALGCVGWALSVNVWPTVVTAIVYLLYLVISYSLSLSTKLYVWYIAEIAGFTIVFATYFLLYIIK